MDTVLPDEAPGASGALAACAGDLAPEPSRRRLLAKSAAVGISLALGSGLGRARAWAEETVGPTDVFVLVFLRGGLDALNTVVPYGDPAYSAALRPNVRVADPIPLGDGTFGLHPALGALVGTGNAWDPALGIGDLALIHLTGTWQNTRSHFDAQDIADRGVGAKSDPDKDGWLARHLLARSAHSATLRAVAMADATPLSLYRRGLTPVLMRTPASLGMTMHTATGTEAAMRALYSGFTHSMAPAGLTALDSVTAVRSLGTYSPRLGVTYGTDALAQAFKTVAQLVKADPAGSPVRFGLEAVAIDHGPYDLHRGMGTSASGALRDRLAELGNALAAFRADLQDVDGTAARRFWDRVTVCVVSEFGRRNEENGAGGTEHGHGGVAMVTGGRITGRAPGSTSNVWLRGGVWPGVGAGAGELPVRVDLRDVFREIAANRLGARSADLSSTVFPGHTPAALGFTGA